MGNAELWDKKEFLPETFGCLYIHLVRIQDVPLWQTGAFLCSESELWDLKLEEMMAVKTGLWTMEELDRVLTLSVTGCRRPL